MANGVFTITEITTPGDPAAADDGERFEWTSDSRPITPFDGSAGGGARACPLKPWAMGLEQHMVRTNYPNAKLPSRQILGPRYKQQTFRGHWDDRYNGPGYAEFELARFERMAKRGNLIRMQYGAQVFEGVIAGFDPTWLKSWRVEYEFVVDIDGRPGDDDRVRVPVTPADPSTSLDRLDLFVQSMLDTDGLAPRNAVAGTLSDDVTASLVNSVSVRDGLAATIDQRDLAPPENPVDGFTRVATQFRAARGAAFALVTRLAEVRSDLDMATRTAMSVLDFEDWTRSLRWYARMVMGSALEGDRAATARSDPNASRLYRPQAGEHLYAVARKFYGTPHAWRLIYDRNALRSIQLTGAEILIIPERGGV